MVCAPFDSVSTPKSQRKGVKTHGSAWILRHLSASGCRSRSLVALVREAHVVLLHVLADVMNDLDFLHIFFTCLFACLTNDFDIPSPSKSASTPEMIRNRMLQLVLELHEVLVERSERIHGSTASSMRKNS